MNQIEKGAVLDCVDHVRRAPEAVLRTCDEGFDLARRADVPGVLLRVLLQHRLAVFVERPIVVFAHIAEGVDVARVPLARRVGRPRTIQLKVGRGCSRVRRLEILRCSGREIRFKRVFTILRGRWWRVLASRGGLEEGGAGVQFHRAVVLPVLLFP